MVRTTGIKKWVNHSIFSIPSSSEKYVKIKQDRKNIIMKIPDFSNKKNVDISISKLSKSALMTNLNLFSI